MSHLVVENESSCLSTLKLLCDFRVSESVIDCPVLNALEVYSELFKQAFKNESSDMGTKPKVLRLSCST